MRIGIKPDNYYKDRKRLEAGYGYSDIPILLESDNIEFGENFEFEGEFYRACTHSPKHNFLLVKKIEIDFDNKFEENNDRIKCPVCGDENHDSWECNNEDDDYECGNCGAILSYTSEVTRTFYVDLKEMPKIKSAIPGAAGNSSAEDGSPNTRMKQ